jgi:hypothetical protein
MATFIEKFPNIKDTELTSKGSYNFFHTNKECVKLSYFPKAKSSNNFFVEKEIYEHVFPMLKNHTPNIPVLKRVEYGSLPASFTEKHKSKVTDFDDEFDETKCMALVTEKIEGTQQSQFEPCIMAQILYTLLCFERVGLTHNDLHSNIMITTLDKPIDFYYKVGNRNIVMKTNKKITIIDFDLSSIYHDKVQRNYYLECIDDHGSGLVKGRDLFRLARSFLFAPFFSSCFPKIFSARYGMSKQQYSVYMDLESVIGSMESNLLRLVDFFPHSFTDEIRDEMIGFSPPEDCAVRFKLENPVFKTDESQYVGFFTWINKQELFLCGYDVQAHAIDLYHKIKEKFKEEKDCDVFNACIVATNPLRTDEEKTPLSEKIMEYYTPAFVIPQKPTTKTEYAKIWEEETGPKDEKQKNEPKEDKPKEGKQDMPVRYYELQEKIEFNNFSKEELEKFRSIPPKIRRGFPLCKAKEISRCFLEIEKTLKMIGITTTFIKYTGKRVECTKNFSQLLQIMHTVPDKEKKKLLAISMIYLSRKIMLRHMTANFAKTAYYKCVELSNELPCIMDVLTGKITCLKNIRKSFVKKEEEFVENLGQLFD